MHNIELHYMKLINLCMLFNCYSFIQTQHKHTPKEPFIAIKNRMSVLRIPLGKLNSYHCGKLTNSCRIWYEFPNY